MKLGKIVLDGKFAPDNAVIYIVKDGSEILYVGKSLNVELRLAQHLGYDTPPSSGYFDDEAARAAIPQCWDWDVEFVLLPEEILNSGNLARVNRWIANEEVRLNE